MTISVMLYTTEENSNARLRLIIHFHFFPQADVLVVPMFRCQLTSTNIGKSLLRRAGNQLKFLFDIMAARFTLNPGDVLQVDAPPSLCCSKLFFIECLPWDGVSGQSVQVR